MQRVQALRKFDVGGQVILVYKPIQGEKLAKDDLIDFEGKTYRIGNLVSPSGPPPKDGLVSITAVELA